MPLRSLWVADRLQILTLPLGVRLEYRSRCNPAGYTECVYGCSFNGKETVRNRRLAECRTKERPVHGLDTADPCEQRPQVRIKQLGHRLRVGDRCAALQRCRVA